MNKLGFGAALFAAITLAGCGGGGGGGGGSGSGPLPTPSLSADVPIPNFAGSGVAASFDLVYVDQANHAAMFTDRNNKSVDKITYPPGPNGTIAASLNAQFSAGLGFTGCTATGGPPGGNSPGCGAANTGLSGPNGLHGLVGTTTVLAGDVQKIVVFDSSTGALIKSIPATNPVLGNTGFRTDEGCVLPAGPKSPIPGVAISAFSNTSEAPKPVGAASRGTTFYTFVRLDTNAVIGQLVMPNSAGQELCLFDTTGAAAIMYYDDDGDLPAVNSITATANPDGSLDAIHLANLFTAFAAAPVGVNGNKYIILDTNANVAADIVAGFWAAGAVGAGATAAGMNYITTPATGIWRRAAGFDTAPGIPAGFNCLPAGIALNTTNNTDVAISCRPPLGEAGTLLVVNRNTGAVVATPNAGLGDQMQFDAVGNRYLIAASRWTSTGLSPNSCLATPATRVCTPRLNVVDATTFAILNRIPIGNNAHAVDFDSSQGLAFVPYSNAILPVGCGDCAANGFNIGGVSVIKFR
jgi:hypothetical protein